MTRAYALGTASQPFRVGDPPELWPGPNAIHLYATRPGEPGYCALYARYIFTDKTPGTGHEREDHWEEGQHAAVQLRNRAIVAYPPLPRVAPARSYKLSIRLLGVSSDAEIWVGDRRVDAWATRVDVGHTVVLAF